VLVTTDYFTKWTEVVPLKNMTHREVIQFISEHKMLYEWLDKNELSAVNYHNLMLDRLDEVSDERVKALGEIERDKLRVAKAYNKRVKEKSFQVGDLI
jgi:hypothetical protein